MLVSFGTFEAELQLRRRLELLPIPRLHVYVLPRSFEFFDTDAEKPRNPVRAAQLSLAV
jgi:hypothetical protein